MVERVPCEKCGNLVVSTSRLCPVCREHPNKIRDAFGAGLGFALIAWLAWNGIQKQSEGSAVRSKEELQSESTKVPSDTAAATDIEVSELSAQPQGEQKGIIPLPHSSPELPIDGVEIAPSSMEERAASAAESRAIGVALDTGNDQEWKAGRLTGRIEVKSTVVEGQSVCRRYRTDREGELSAYATVCQDESGAWQVISSQL